MVNTDRTRDVAARIAVDGMEVRSGRVAWFDVDPEHEVFEYREETVHPKEAALPGAGTWTFPAASVSAVELTVQPARSAGGTGEGAGR